jgi:CBS domain containing-hemolysin-like protein
MTDKKSERMKFLTNKDETMKTKFILGVLSLVPLLFSTNARASEGGSLDGAADVLAWVVLVLAPIIGIVVFLLIHILPEKIAEKKQHPQAGAIQCLCLLSLVFGGLLWPIAWLWAYSKPVLYKMAYGTDKVVHGSDNAGHSEKADAQAASTAKTSKAPKASAADEAEELKQLRKRVAELETKLGGQTAVEGGKA